MHVLVLVDKKIMTYYLGNCLFSGISDNCPSHKLFPYLILAYKIWLGQAVLLCFCRNSSTDILSKDWVNFSRRFHAA